MNPTVDLPNNRLTGATVHTRKVPKGNDGAVPTDIPRDRDGSFEPELIRKGQTRIDGMDDKIVGLYAAGLSTRDGEREVLGQWIANNEGAKFWLSIMNNLKNRGLEDIPPFSECKHSPFGQWIAVVDGLKGFPDTINAAFPDTTVQTCIVHLPFGICCANPAGQRVRHSLNFCGWKDRKAVAKSLRRIYQAVNDEEAAKALDDLRRNGARNTPQSPLAGDACGKRSSRFSHCQWLQTQADQQAGEHGKGSDSQGRWA